MRIKGTVHGEARKGSGLAGATGLVMPFTKSNRAIEFLSMSATRQRAISQRCCAQNVDSDPRDAPFALLPVRGCGWHHTITRTSRVTPAGYINMALPRFLYSTSDSAQERLLQNAESGGVFGTFSKSDLTRALIRSKRQIASNPALPPAFVVNLTADSGEEGAQQENRREWEFGGAAELSEPGTGEVGSGRESGSDSDESGMLERMAGTRQKSRRGSGERNGVMVGGGQGNRDMVGINADVSTSPSVHTRASRRSSALLRSLSGTYNIGNCGEILYYSAIIS